MADRFRLALGAGHRLDTPGKRCLKSLDPAETREWVLNDRICDKVEALLAAYDGIEVLRVDDTEGVENITVAQRNAAANSFGADFALAVHHNAGINGGTGGGIVAYVCHGVGTDTTDWQKALYGALIAHTGMKGNRANPLAVADYQMLTGTFMPAVLLELGFMDSSTDVPIILTDEYATQCAEAIVEVIVERAGLTSKAAAEDGSPWSAEARDWAVAQGLFVGDADGNFRWKDNVTREELAVVLQRLSK